MELHWNRAGIVLELCWNCTGAVLELDWPPSWITTRATHEHDMSGAQKVMAWSLSALPIALLSGRRGNTTVQVEGAWRCVEIAAKPGAHM